MPVWIPPDVAGRCCGVPFVEGHTRAHAEMVTGTVEALWRWSGEGELPVVVDASSCTLGLTVEAVEALPEPLRERHRQLEILDSVEWLERLLPELPTRRSLGRVAVTRPARSGTWD